jgi:hypothetical protein
LKIEGRTLQNVFVIPRDALRDGDKIWSVDDQSRLKILEVDVIWQDLENVLVKELDAGLNLVVSDIPAPVVGMKVKVTSD